MSVALLLFWSSTKQRGKRKKRTDSYQALSIAISHQKQNVSTQKRAYLFYRYCGSKSHCDSVIKQVEEKQLQILNLCNRAARS